MRRSLAVAAALVLVAALCTRDARAGSNEECIAAAEAAQTLRDQGSYADARDRLGVCLAPSCPAVVQRDCARWMDELMQIWPTIVIGADDLAGANLADVQVFVDDKLVATKLDGSPLLVDPGPHTVRCETAGAPPVRESVLIRTGEKARLVRVRFAKGAAEVGPAAASLPAAPPSHSTARVLRWVSGGVAVVAFGSAALFGFTGFARYNDLKSSCAANLPGNCSPSDVSYVQSHFLVSDISLGVGLAATIAATYFFLTSRAGAASPARKPAVLRPVLQAARGGLLGIADSF
jgi:hypothetical protein